MNRRLSKRNYLYHPFELALSGFSGSGKTTLMEKIISELSHSYKVAYIKHDAHQFSIDKEGRDTYRAKAAGAHAVLINDKQKFAFISDNQSGEMGKYSLRQDLQSCHFALVEGHKSSQIKKLVLIDSKEEIISLIKKNEVTDVLALIVPDEMTFVNDLPYPLFKRNEVQKISSFILDYFLNQSKKSPLFGLILNGGKSSRMGNDKGKLNYHGTEQSRYLFNLLDQYCEQTFISCRTEQKNLDYLSGIPLIEDRILEMGPMGGIMSAMMEFPLSSWLVFACDLPLIDQGHIQELIEHRHPFSLATCHVDQSGLPEPLSCIYRPEMLSSFFYFLGQGVDCPRKVLMNSLTHHLKSSHPYKLANANTHEEYLRYSKEIYGEVKS